MTSPDPGGSKRPHLTTRECFFLEKILAESFSLSLLQGRYRCTGRTRTEYPRDRKKHFYLPDLATSFTAPSRISSPESTRSLVIIRGGAMRRVEWPAVISARPRRKDFIIISCASLSPDSFVLGSFTISAPSINPFPLTSPMISYFSCISFKRLIIYSPCFVAFSIKCSSLIALMTSRAAAHDTGFPPKVFAWDPPSQSMTSVFATVAPIGIPDASALDVQMMSGSTPQCSIPNQRPVLPIPACTSSSTIRIPFLSNSFRNRLKYSGGGTTYPPSP